MKIVAGIGLLFFAYSGWRVVTEWPYRNAIEKTIWFVVIVFGGGWCISVILR